MKELGSILIPAILSIVGLSLLFIPTKSLLRFDRRTGYWIYKRTLKSTGNENKALRAAGIFYKIFGAVFFIFSISFFV